MSLYGGEKMLWHLVMEDKSVNFIPCEIDIMIISASLLLESNMGFKFGTINTNLSLLSSHSSHHLPTGSIVPSSCSYTLAP